ncbi:hypothetical protein LCGC14_3026640, partial [marine sediment metagenome]
RTITITAKAQGLIASASARVIILIKEIILYLPRREVHEPHQIFILFWFILPEPQGEEQCIQVRTHDPNLMVIETQNNPIHHIVF